MATYYQPSGKFSPLSFALLILISLTALPLLAFIYAYGIRYTPVISMYIGFLLTGLFGVCIGYLSNWAVVKLGKVRSPILAVIFGIISTLVAVYIHWAVWVDIFYTGPMLDLSMFQLIFAPDFLFELMGEVNQIGAWTFQSDTAVSGLPLTIVWVLEFLIIIGFSIYFSTSFSKAPFCEKTKTWLEGEELPAFQFIENKDFIVKSLEKGDETIFDEIEIIENSKEESHSSFTLYTPKESGESYLSIDNKSLNYDDDGKPQFNKKSIIRYISVSENLKSKLKTKQNTAPVFRS